MKPLSKYQLGRVNSAFLRAARKEALASQNGCCAYCHDPLPVSRATADHFRPKSNGGLDRRENIVAACGPCNRLKASMSPGEFVKLIKYPNGSSYAFYHAWLKRKLNLRIERAEKRILRSVGIAA